MNDWFIWCSACSHGGHLSHLRDWFSINQLCPAGDCRCACPKVDNILNADPHRKTNNQEMLDDSFLINGFNVNILSATVESGLRSRHNSEQDKMRLIRRLYMSPRQSNLALDALYRRGSNDSGITLNIASPLKSICDLKTSTQQGFIGSEFTNENISAMSNRSDALYTANGLKNNDRHHSEEPRSGKEEAVETNQLSEEPEQSYQEKPFTMIPEVVKQSNAMRKLLQTQNLKQALNKSELDLPDDEQTRRNLLASSDNLSVSEVSRTQRRQHVKIVPKKQSRIKRQYNTNLTEHLNQQASHSNTDPTIDSNKWIINSRDNFGRPIATQVKVNLDESQKTESEPTSSHMLENNIRFNQHTILLPAREQSFATAWLTNPQALQQLVSTEMFKASVAEERASNELKEKRIATQLVKDQLTKEQMRKDARELRKQLRDKASTNKHQQNRPPSQTGSSYFGFDYNAIDVDSASSRSEEELSDAEDVENLVQNVKQNIKQEEIEINRLREHGFHDLSSLASAIKDAEEKKKRSKKGPKRVRIRTTPDIRTSKIKTKASNDH